VLAEVFEREINTVEQVADGRRNHNLVRRCRGHDPGCGMDGKPSHIASR
jgi:hypothetical protein